MYSLFSYPVQHIIAADAGSAVDDVDDLDRDLS